MGLIGLVFEIVGEGIAKGVNGALEHIPLGNGSGGDNSSDDDAWANQESGIY